MDDHFVGEKMPQVPINKSFIFTFREVGHGPSQVYRRLGRLPTVKHFKLRDMYIQTLSHR